MARIRGKANVMSNSLEYDGPPFVAHDEAGNDYMLVPVYRCQVDAAGDQVGRGYAVHDLDRLWTATGDIVRRDALGHYTILDNHPRRQVALTSNHPKCI